MVRPAQAATVVGIEMRTAVRSLDDVVREEACRRTDFAAPTTIDPLAPPSGAPLDLGGPLLVGIGEKLGVSSLRGRLYGSGVQHSNAAGEHRHLAHTYSPKAKGDPRAALTTCRHSLRTGPESVPRLRLSGNGADRCTDLGIAPRVLGVLRGSLQDHQLIQCGNCCAIPFREMQAARERATCCQTYPPQ